jgi:hypothetical protein
MVFKRWVLFTKNLVSVPWAGINMRLYREKCFNRSCCNTKCWEFFVPSVIAEVELMKERFAKLLLGDDMSGGAKGVCTALAISNAITNLSGICF